MDTFKPKFSTSNTWLLLRQPAPTVAWHSSNWFSHATPKYAFMARLAVHNRLSTGDIMLSWNVGNDATCILCTQHLETRDQLLFSCSYSREVWSRLVKRLFPARYSDQWHDIMATLADKNIPTLKLYLLRYTFQATLHSIWRERNNRRHGSQSTPTGRLISMIDRTIRNQCLILDSKRVRRHEGALQLWLSAR